VREKALRRKALPEGQVVRSILKSLTFGSAVLAVLVLGASANGQSPQFLLGMMDANDPGMTEWTPTVTSGPDGTQNTQGMRAADHWTCEWDITGKSDPWINAVVTITNVTASTQTYTFLTTLPVNPTLAAPTLHGGSVQGGLTDNSEDGVIGKLETDPVSGAPLYLGMIDGVGVLSLYSAPQSFPVPFDGGSASIPAISAGLPGPTLPSGAVNNTIGIQHKFTLTAGDSATFTSYFKVVPEPATLALAAIGGLAILRRRR